MSLRIDRVYTRAGDDGRTFLATNERVSKSHSQICVLGAIDELNAALGMVFAVADAAELITVVDTIQQELFDIGAEIARAGDESVANAPVDALISEESIKRLEVWCDDFGAGLPELSSFVLSGSCELSSRLHIARVSARKAERDLVALVHVSNVPIRKHLIAYLNRVSDLLFILSRWTVVKSGNLERLWVLRSGRSR